jgi:hypothetical protein
MCKIMALLLVLIIIFRLCFCLQMTTKKCRKKVNFAPLLNL